MALQHQYDDDDSEDLQIHLVPELRKRIKQAAEESHLSVQEYIESFLEQTYPAEPIPLQKYQDGLNLAAIQDVLAYRDELQRAHPDVFWNTLEEIYQMREERLRELDQR
ncbi:MAG TPA: hypothetical protein DHW02_24335 [Ktedonobacter sp.]|nr:hypothetical protein [Ktedonobacter sp.]